MAMQRRMFRMEDDQYEALAALAVVHGRTIAEEQRIAVDAWLKMCGVEVSSERRTVAPHPNARQIAADS